MAAQGEATGLNKVSSEGSCEQCPWHAVSREPVTASCSGRAGLASVPTMSLGHQEDKEAEQVCPEHSWPVGALVWLTWEQHPEILLGSRAVLHPRDPGTGSTSVLFSPGILPESPLLVSE